MKRTVVVGIDATTNSEDALVWAAEAAVARDAELVIVHAVGRSVWRSGPGADRSAEDAGAALLRRRADLVRHLLPTLQASTVLTSGSPVHALVEASKDAVLLVVGSGRVRRADRPVTRSRSYRVAAAAHCSVAVVPAIPHARAHGVVLGVDGSADGAAAVALAAEEADRTGDGLCALHVWNDPAGFPDAYLEPGVGDRTRDLEAAVLVDAVAGLRDRYPDLRVEQRLVRGVPADELLEAAEEARVLVVGNRGRRGLTRILLGSVSHDVVLAAHCPVVVARKRAPSVPGTDPTAR